MKNIPEPIFNCKNSRSRLPRQAKISLLFFFYLKTMQVIRCKHNIMKGTKSYIEEISKNIVWVVGCVWRDWILGSFHILDTRGGVKKILNAVKFKKFYNKKSALELYFLLQLSRLSFEVSSPSPAVKVTEIISSLWAFFVNFYLFFLWRNFGQIIFKL